MGQTFNRTMYNLHKTVNSKETIVGWYATSMDGTFGRPGAFAVSCCLLTPNAKLAT